MQNFVKHKSRFHNTTLSLIENYHLGDWSDLLEDGFRTGCPNVSRQQQSISGP